MYNSLGVEIEWQQDTVLNIHVHSPLTLYTELSYPWNSVQCRTIQEAEQFLQNTESLKQNQI